MYYRLIPILITVTLFTGVLGAKDIPGSKDHPLVKRYKDSEIRGYDMQKYGELTLPLGKAVLNGSVEYAKKERVEGRLTRLLYLVPDDRATLEVYKNYEEELRKGGFEPLFECRGDDECGRLFHQAIWSQERALHNVKYLEMVFNTPEDQRLMVAKRSGEAGDVYTVLYVAKNASSVPDWAKKRVTVLFEVLETAKMEQNMVTVSAEKMSREISTSGHIALYGIYFDTDKADIKPESHPLLSEIAKLLGSDPALSLYIVGHTDNTGSFAHNEQLSRKRAESVVKYLVSKEKIDAKRLKGYGVGPLAPVASNDTEEGRAKNRRVELIKQ